MHAEGNGCDRGDQSGIGVTENYPEADPSCGEAYVHWVAHVAVETDYDQVLRRSDGSGRAAADPAEVPDAAQGDCESERGGNGGEPSPACSALHFHGEAEPSRQQPEP